VSLSGQTFYTFIIENIENFGALKAIGATGNGLIGMILFQAAVLGLAFAIVVIIASTSSYIGVREVSLIEQFNIFRGNGPT
jgi:putative ABC transport system permease protein